MSTLSVQMNKWYVTDAEEDQFVVIHYVGGEEGFELHDYYDNEDHAFSEAVKLNSQGITYGWKDDGNGGVNLIIDWNEDTTNV